MTLQEIVDLCDKLDCKPTPEELLRDAFPLCYLSAEAMKEVQEQLEAIVKSHDPIP